MKRPKLISSILIILLLSSTLYSMAQDSIPAKTEKVFRNTVRYNLTNPLFFGGRSVIFGYERTVGRHKSFCINIGQAALNKPSDWVNERGDMKLEKKVEDKGFHISGDFRFYLKKENKYNAPRGVYIGPYYGYNYFERKNTWDLTTRNYTGQLSTKYTLSLHTVGFELGYQFVFWKRIALDLVLCGPGLSFYHITADVDATLSQEDREVVFDGIHKALSERVPLYDQFVDGASFSHNGNTRSSTIGFRYIFHLGFRF